jgi:hypothetical protein
MVDITKFVEQLKRCLAITPCPRQEFSKTTQLPEETCMVIGTLGSRSALHEGDRK